MSAQDRSGKKHLRLVKPSKSSVALKTELDKLRTLSGRAKYKAILESPESRALVQAMPAQDLFLLVKELGPADVSELLSMASGVQVTLCVDMDCWRGDSMDADEALFWLQHLHQMDNDDTLRLVDELDFDMLVLLVKKQLRIVRGLEALDDDELEEPRLRRDQLYECEFRDTEQAKWLEGLLELLFSERQSVYLQLMEAVRHETDITFEEAVFQDRIARLSDFGFIETHEALKIRAWLDPEHFDPAAYLKSQATFTPEYSGVSLPGFVMTVARPRDLLADVMSNSLNDALWQELTYLLNRAMSADQVDIGDVTEVQESLEDVYNYLNIALGYLAGSDVERATELFEQVYFQSLYRLGFSLTIALKRRARIVLKSPAGPYLDGPDAALVSALNQPKPRFYSGVETTTRADERPFRNYSEVKAVSVELETVEALLPLFGSAGIFNIPAPEELELEGCIPPQASEVTLSELFLTAIANKILEHDPTPEPIPAAELETLHQALHAEANFDALRHQTKEWLVSLAPDSGAFVEFCFDLWEHEFYALKPENLKPQYIGGLLIRL
ncbi:MAG: DUF6178 family protein [Desulfuromonadaceae bacterium]|nr:DUF6178 family protein [Desulfuromonadaceae bacterium]